METKLNKQERLKLLKELCLVYVYHGRSKNICIDELITVWDDMFPLDIGEDG